MIRYVTGDATNPLAPGQKILPHVCNNIGKWGRGYVMAISAKWPAVRDAYLEWYKRKEFGLGKVLYVQVTPHITIANMVAQAGIKTGSKGPPIRYDALEECLTDVAKTADAWTRHPSIWSPGHNMMPAASLHMPKIGTGLAGGSWTSIEPIPCLSGTLTVAR